MIWPDLWNVIILEGCIRGASWVGRPLIGNFMANNRGRWPHGLSDASRWLHACRRRGERAGNGRSKHMKSPRITWRALHTGCCGRAALFPSFSPNSIPTVANSIVEKLNTSRNSNGTFSIYSNRETPLKWQHCPSVCETCHNYAVEWPFRPSTRRAW